MPNVAVDIFYADTEQLPDIEPYFEYRGDVVLMASTYESALGPDIVAAEIVSQGAQSAKVRASQDVAKVSDVKVPHRVIDDLVDPYNSPMLDGFLQSDFTPEAPILDAEVLEL